MHIQFEFNEGDADFTDTYNLSSSIKKVRKIAKFFRRSVKNDLLQAKVKKEIGKELHFILDTKTRWNSMLKMITRFEELKQFLPDILKTLGATKLYPTEGELEIITDLVTSLKIINVGADTLGRRDCNISQADTVFDFMLSNLASQKGTISATLKARLEVRITERRDPIVSGLLRYLENPDQYGKGDTFLKYPPRKQLITPCIQLYKRLFPTEQAAEQAEQAADQAEQSDIEVLPEELNKTNIFQQQLDEILSQTAKVNDTPNAKGTIQEALNKELALFYATSKRPSMLEKLFNSLRCIQVLL